MTNYDYAEFEGAMSKAALVTFMQKNKDWDALIDAMFDGLEDYSLEEVKAAISAHCKSEKFFPTLADVVRHIDGSKEDLSAVAWRTFLKAIERWGYYDSVRFPDPAYHYAIEQLGGWVKLSEDYHALTDRDIEFRRKEWVKLYEIGLRVASWSHELGKVSVPSIMHGFHERNNNSLGRLDMLPSIISVATGDAITREALGLTAERLPQLSVVGGDEN